MKNLSTLIKEKRVGLGMTQEELAKKLIVSRQAVSNWERNKTYPDLEKLKDLADMFNLTIDEMLYSEAQKNRNGKLIYKRLLSLIVVIIVAVASIKLYRIVFPPHISMIANYKGRCEIDTVSIYKYSITPGSGEIISNYNIQSHQEVNYDFGTYCVPLSTTVKIINNNWDDAIFNSHINAPGFTIEAEHFFGNSRDDNMYIDTHQTITLIEDNTGRTIRHSANSGIQFKFPYPLDEQSVYNTKLIRRDKYDLID